MGSKKSWIKVIGTSHISRSKAYEVKETIYKDLPDFVCVELDYKRFLSLTKNPKHLKKPSAIQMIRSFGFFTYLFNSLGSFIQKRLAKSVGTRPGIDMLLAIKSAKDIGAGVVLIDQDVEILFRKISKQVPLREKLGLFFSFFSDSKLKKEFTNFDITKVPPEEMINHLVCHLRKKLPNIYRILIFERNLYMARKILSLHHDFPDKNILAVVGAGHAKDIADLVRLHAK